MSGISEHLLQNETASKSMESADFDAFAKGISLFAKALKPRVFSIQESKMLAATNYSSTISELDFTGQLPLNTNMVFVNRKEDLNALRELEAENRVILLEDGSFYYFTSETNISSLKKYRASTSTISTPDLSDATLLSEPVSVSNTDSISKITKNAEWTALFTHNKQLSGFITSNSIYRLFTGNSCRDVFGKPPDLILKSLSFFQVVGSYAELALFSHDGHFWLVTKTDIGKPRKGGEKTETETIGPAVTVYERLKPMTIKQCPRILTHISNGTLNRDASGV
jgi:hypothetical protein